MGQVAVVDHGSKKITLSMVRFGLPRRILLHIAKQFRLIDRYKCGVFTPRYEIAVFDGGPNAVFSLHTPYMVFYYRNSCTATRKLAELSAVVEQGGLHGDPLVQFIRTDYPNEQEVYPIGL